MTSRRRVVLLTITLLVAAIVAAGLLSTCEGDPGSETGPEVREDPESTSPEVPAEEPTAEAERGEGESAPVGEDAEPDPDLVAVEVILLDGVTGHHLPGAEIEFLPRGGSPQPLRPVGDRYRHDGWSFPRDGYLRVSFRVRPPAGQALESIGSPRFWVKASPTTRLLVFTIVTRPEIVWRIRVLDEKREPVAGAKLAEFSVLGSVHEVSSTVSDAEGWMTVRGIPDLRGQLLTATVVEGKRRDLVLEKVPRRGGRFESRALLRPIRPRRDAVPALSLGDGSIGLGGGREAEPPPPPKTPTYRTAPVLVTVRDRAGKPVPFAALSVIDPDGPDHIHVEGDVQYVGIRTDVEGKRVLNGLPEGLIRIRAELGTRSAEAEVAEDGTVELILR